MFLSFELEKQINNGFESELQLRIRILIRACK